MDFNWSMSRYARKDATQNEMAFLNESLERERTEMEIECVSGEMIHEEEHRGFIDHSSIGN
jgi:hypothetical protein